MSLRNRNQQGYYDDMDSEKAHQQRSSEASSSRLLPTSDIQDLHERLESDPRFSPPVPSVWKRVALLATIALLFWLAFSLQSRPPKVEKVVHANRYSKEHKFRPAASPIITEKMKDGRTKLRGAAPTFR